jgi:hypothetical protein
MTAVVAVAVAVAVAVVVVKLRTYRLVLPVRYLPNATLQGIQFLVAVVKLRTPLDVLRHK